MRLFKWAALLAVIALIGWRVMLLVTEPSHAAVTDNALRQAFALRNSDPAAARELLREAAWRRPTDGRIYVLLAALAEQERPLRAAGLVQRGEQLAPQQLETRLAAGAFWARQNEFARALESWDVALRDSPSSALRDSLFPALLALSESAAGERALRQIIAQSPPWWGNFIRYFAHNAPDLAAVQAFYRHTETVANSGLANAARQAYLQRLEQEQRWREAYFIWLNGLNLRHLSQFGNVHNGEFELPLSNAGFGWRYRAEPGIILETAFVGNDSNDKALYIGFRPAPAAGELTASLIAPRPSAPTVQLSQYLLLAPGDYQLRGVASTRRLPDDANFHWLLSCLDQPDAEPFARSRTFSGTLRWQQFRTNFTIPKQGCAAQKLELTQSRSVTGEGELWFDGLVIERRTERRGGSLGRRR